VTEPLAAIDPAGKQQPDLAVELAQALAPEVVEALVKWQEDFRTTIIFDRWLVPGLSGAQVASVALSGQAGPRKVVMKVCPPGQTTGKEPTRHLQALKDAPQKFAARHLVRQPIAPVKASRGWWVMFQEIAGGSTRSVRALSALRGRQLPALAATIVSSVLADWNPAPDVVSKTPVEFLLEHLGGRLAAGGPFDNLLGELTYTSGLDGTGHSRWVRAPQQRAAPNIAAWIRDRDWGGVAGQHILALYGKAHGDLQPDNIVLPVGPQPMVDKYHLIDLSAYSEAAPLSRDPGHLLLSCIITEVSEMTEVQRQAVADFLIEPAMDAPAQLQVSGVCDIANDISEAGEGFARRVGMLDDWQDMQLLSLAGNALLFAMRPVDLVIRGWAYQLACNALGRFLTGRGIEAPPGRVPLLTFGAGAAAVGVAEAVEALSAACGRWSGSSASIAVVDSDALDDEAIARFVRLGWDLVVEMNARTDITGGWASTTSDAARVHRLRLPGQDLIFGRNSTLWLAAAGLSDVDPVNPADDLRGWRRRYLRFVTEAFEALARHTAKPVTVTCFGSPGRAQLAVGEAAVDVFGDRARLVVVSDTGAGDLADYAADVVCCKPNTLLRAIGPVSVVGDVARRPTLPSADGPKLAPDEATSRLGDTAQLLHSEVGVENDSADADIGGFYRGRPISWFELDLDLDVPRRVTDDLLVRVTDALEQRDTLRIMLGHSPGAGGTTVARRIAWRIKDTYPTVVVRTISDDAVLAEAVADLAQISGMPVLLVVELVPESILDRFFGMLRARSVPAVLLISARRTSRRYGQRSGDGGVSAVDVGPASQRGLRLGPMTRRDERVQMAQRFAQMVPERADALYALTGGSPAINVPFFYALTAFDDEFEGLSEYVMQFLTGLRDEEREILILTALVHRFSGIAVPAELFAPLLNVSRSSPVELAKLVNASLLDLLAEDEPGTWRMTHSLIAEEVLRQLLTPTERVSSRDDWRAALPAWSLRLVEHASAVYGRYLPEDMKLILARLYTMRDDREPVELPHGTSTYTELLQSMSSPGRLEVMRQLVEAFPQEPHFWGHLGRLLSYDQNDYAGALGAVDRAITLSPHDALLHHMRGMVFRNQIRNLIRQLPSRNVRAVEPERENAVLSLVEPARNAFREASALDDTSEYGHIALARMCVDVIEFGYQQSGERTYAAFLAKPMAGVYRDLLEEAEQSIDAAQEIRGDDRASFAAGEAELGVLRLYDDYQSLLQGWRSLLDRPDLYKPPIRRRLARAYRNRHGSWRKASPRDVRQAVELLEENLRDDPRDFASLLEWLWAARFIPVSVDRAADLVETWASTENDRDALFYDYVLTSLRVLKGQDSAIPEYQRKLERSKERSTFFGNRRFSYEWLGEGTELGVIVHHTDLRDWDRSGDEPAPPILSRVTGRVSKISGPASGTIDFGRGIEAFFVPQRVGLHRGVDENRRVSALLSFRYDGPQAWSVRSE
jgi:tetratricopeptide (TPR) repeat protein